MFTYKQGIFTFLLKISKPSKAVAAGLIFTKFLYDSYSTAKDIKDIACYSYEHK